MGETNPPTQVDYAADAAHTARTTANANAGALELLLGILVAKGVLTQDDFNAVHQRSMWR